MPLVSAYWQSPLEDGRQSETALMIRNGVVRGLSESGLSFLPEVTLRSGRRADLVAVDPKGSITIFEIKSSVADFRGDDKWPEYRDYCDRLYFATHEGVPADIFPASEGLIIADRHGCHIVREAGHDPLAAARRKQLTILLARTAANRLQRLSNSGLEASVEED